VTSSGSSSVFAGFRFPREVISVAVRWYLRYGLSYRDIEELMAERGVTVDHVTIYRWVQRFTPEFIEAARSCRHAPGDRWFADETYVKVAGQWAYLYRAVDQHGQVIDVLLSVRRDLAAARSFFIRALQAGLPAAGDLRPLRCSTSGKLAAAHATKPPSRSAALTRPSRCKVAAAKLDWKPSLQIRMSGRDQSVIWGCRHCEAGSQRHSSELRGSTRAPGTSPPTQR
jgi:hypothetical protein